MTRSDTAAVMDCIISVGLVLGEDCVVSGLLLGIGGLYYISRTGTGTVVYYFVSIGLDTGAIMYSIVYVGLLLGQKCTVVSIGLVLGQLWTVAYQQDWYRGSIITVGVVLVQ